ncbi:3-hydroxybutyryl-CoA dehydrogenase [Cupriavidus sp. TA19]|nr:3-hydroxybutyryl-CoA dehydrogenase [Cupriavidus sp. TA19]
MEACEFVGIVGTGTMGSGIAQAAALADFRVIAIDVMNASIDKAKAEIEKSLGRLVNKGTITSEAAEAATTRIAFSTDYNDLVNADVVVEAATEAAELKRTILRRISAIAKPSALIATNTSSLSVTSLASEIGAPKQFVGIHFFNPVAVMPLVEIVKGVETADSTCDRALALSKALGKTPILVKNSAGFVVNRLLIPMINEAFFLLGENVASALEIDQGMRLGANHPMGRLSLADLIGLDVCLAIMQVLATDTGDSKYRAAPLMRELVASGRLGRKAGRGVFSYG